MRLFLDTNIFLDLLLQREYEKEALIILNSINRGIHEGILLDITLVNIAYVARKQRVDIEKFLKLILQNCYVVGGNNQMGLDALKLEHHDFEDALQYISAKETACDVVVTNDKGFYIGDLETMSSCVFVEKFIG